MLGNTNLTLVRGDQTMDIKVPEDILNKVSDLGIEAFISRMPLLTSTVDSIIPGKSAAKAGLEKGDRIVAINGVQVKYDADVRSLVPNFKGKTIPVEVNRGAEHLFFNVPIDTAGTIGIAFNFDEIKEETLKYSLMAALPVGANQAWKTFSDNAKGI